jgi:hypothetical protein
MRYDRPNTEGSKLQYKARYGNYINGEFVRPARAVLRERLAVTGRPFCEIPRSTGEDIERALDAAHAAKAAWGRHAAGGAGEHPQQDRRRDGANLELLALSESWDNGKPIRETLAADLPLAIDHFRYFAGCIRADEGSASELDADTLSLPHQGAARRRRPDHPVELPAADGRVEAGPGAGRGQLRGAQARRADPGDDPAVRGAGRAPAAAGRAQHRQRLRGRGRQAPGQQPAGQPRSRSPARPRPGASSCNTPRRTSSR